MGSGHVRVHVRMEGGHLGRTCGVFFAGGFSSSPALSAHEAIATHSDDYSDRKGRSQVPHKNPTHAPDWKPEGKKGSSR